MNCLFAMRSGLTDIWVELPKKHLFLAYENPRKPAFGAKDLRVRLQRGFWRRGATAED
jgi:hypothetical protein